MRDLLYVPQARPEASGAIGLLLPEFARTRCSRRSPRRWRRTRRGTGSRRSSATPPARPLREVDYVHMLLERRVDGMVFICAEVTDVRSQHAHYAQLIELGASLVFVNGASESLEVTSVGVDERAAGSDRHRAPGRARPPPHRLRRRRRPRAADAGEARRPGGRAARAAGSSPTATSRTGRSRSPAAGRCCASSSRSHPEEPPTGVICSNDLMAIGVLQEAAALGLRVPDDLSVVGLRRHRGDRVDAAGADDDRAADRRDREDRDRGAEDADPGSRPGARAATCSVRGSSSAGLPAAELRRVSPAPSGAAGSPRQVPSAAEQALCERAAVGVRGALEPSGRGLANACSTRRSWTAAVQTVL